MFMVYKGLRYFALRSNGVISSNLWKLWLTVGRDYADGVLATGRMLKIPSPTSIDEVENVELNVN